ncbi:hypothetical protein RUMHYD_01630 [Blautia hydrogenotrophica DSM 10507]|uniref:Uncharacterized protein n=1 Tax=Blautia hydrogenotrophica (strain DSM 10507 / JCM 14656 / S5a33) TaxID=476272 RepID=C0CLA9_BLAHS|nr:hypothetical protein RUMHYD_01630 [Blautia hydrogenotrophica DSM 10507]
MKHLKDSTLLDRFLFSEVIDNPKCLETVLEIILGRDVLLRCLSQTEKEKDGISIPSRCDAQKLPGFP